MLQANDKIDFWRDLDMVSKSLLNEFGIKYRQDKKTDDLLLDFLSVRRKMVSEKPRKVLITPLLKEKLSTHPKRAVVEHSFVHLTTKSLHKYIPYLFALEFVVQNLHLTPLLLCSTSTKVQGQYN